MTSESAYQAYLIKQIRERLPGCLILKNDANYLQGIPDLSIFYHDRWGMLEVKMSMNAPDRPNQAWYVDQLNCMSFAAFIYPENEEVVLDALQYTLRHPRSRSS